MNQELPINTADSNEEKVSPSVLENLLLVGLFLIKTGFI